MLQTETNQMTISNSAARSSSGARIRLLLLSLVPVFTVVGCGGGSNTSAGFATPAGNTTPVATTLTCDDSIKTTFKQENTTVVLVKAFKKGDRKLSANSLGAAPYTFINDICLVKLLVGPGNPGPIEAPSTSAGIGIEVWLPSAANWNGRYHATGNGGWAGTAESIPTLNSQRGGNEQLVQSSFYADTQGDVTSSDDTGHYSGNFPSLSNGAFAMSPDGAINETLWRDFATRGIHQQVVTAKKLATAYYGKAPKYSYWTGGSTGGRQGLRQVQDYPNDFDGVVVGQPAIYWTRFLTGDVYPQTVMLQDLGGPMTVAQLNLASNAAINACDMVGGQHMGYINDPSSCAYDPTKDPAVLCTASGGTNGTADCLSSSQAKAMNKMWYGMTSDGTAPDPATDLGWGTSLTGNQRWYGYSRGTSMLSVAGPAPLSLATDQLALELQNPTMATPSFVNATGKGADGWKGLNYAQLSNAYDRGLALQGAFSNINTEVADLSAFKAHGGKLIHLHGLADTIIPAQGSIFYYNRVMEALGGAAAVQSFYKLYLVPGIGHGIGNGTSNPNAVFPEFAPSQTYELLKDWVEKGIVSDRVDATSMNSTGSKVSAPICAYPKKRTYTSGAPTDSASYTCS